MKSMEKVYTYIQTRSLVMFVTVNNKLKIIGDIPDVGQVQVFQFFPMTPKWAFHYHLRLLNCTFCGQSFRVLCFGCNSGRAGFSLSRVIMEITGKSTSKSNGVRHSNRNILCDRWSSKTHFARNSRAYSYSRITPIGA